MYLRYSFLLLAGYACGQSLPRDVPTLKSDISSITTATDKLDGDINAFPNSGGTVSGALAIHNDAIAVQKAVNQGTNDAKNTAPLNDAAGMEIYDSVHALQPTIVDALNVIVQKKPAFDALPLNGISTIVLNDLKGLNASVAGFADSLIAISPLGIVGAALQLKSDIIAAFDTAITAYTT
ncbi:hydrophobic surface binding protein [Flagelloscypha sp. PMI_526]|nr:hydrophobic surface binding protein [Flagelloscypha sp. PMI_526]